MPQWANSVGRWLIFGIVAVGLLGCSERPTVARGGTCDLTIDCDAPLVCRLGACREECRDARDCRAGLVCVRDGDDFGVCQLASEGECASSDTCPEGLVCRFGECTNQCDSDRDCVNGLICAPDPDAMMQLACLDPSTAECRIDSDCAAGLVCARDLRCRDECREDRDCRDGEVCDMVSSPRICFLPDPLPRPPPNPTFATGGSTTCAATATGTTLTCFGANESGQAGDGTTTTPRTPGNVLMGAPIVSLGVGRSHACAITDALRCWGANVDGQLGLPGVMMMASPTVVPMVIDPIGVAVGFKHTCVWSATELRCWGFNRDGQLGDGTVLTRDTAGPAIAIGGPVVHASAGETHTCAVRDDGTLFCWGRNDFRQLGDFSTIPSTTPVRAAVSDVVEVALGRSHTCVLKRDRTVRCWGEGSAGQLGNGETETMADAVIPVGLGPVVQITAGSEHTCVLQDNGEVQCFGAGGRGQLGVMVMPPLFGVATPVTVGLPGDAAEVRAGERYTCARLTDGSAHCFGSNVSGQFGDLGADGPMPRAVSWPP